MLTGQKVGAAWRIKADPQAAWIQDVAEDEAWVLSCFVFLLTIKTSPELSGS